MIYTRHSLKLLYGLIICSNFLLVEGIYAGIDSISISNSYSSSTLEAARIIDFSEDHLYRLKDEYQVLMRKGDTLNGISVLARIGYVYSHHANYSKSYNYLWEALLLADQINDHVSIAYLNEQIGWLYSYFNRKEAALKYLQLSLMEYKALIQERKVLRQQLISSYYGLCIFFRESGEYELSKQYLDSCYSVFYSLKSPDFKLNYVNSELGYYYLNQGQSQKAIELLLRQVEYFKKRNENYLTIIYSFLGDAYLMESELDLSVKYYKWALSISEANNSHGNYRPTLYKKLSKVYVQKRDYKNAYEALEKAKELDELLYDSRSFNNKPLLEISDEFRKEKEVQKKLIQEQRIAQLEYEDSVGSLQLIIMLVVFIALVILAYLYIRFVKSKHKSEQALITKSIDLENQKQRELLELKNKELASSALRLIEKDEVIRRLKTAIVDKKESLSDAAIKRLFKSISGSSVQNWEEFEARFMAVNESFYERLNKQFPNLTQGDRKLCALIKLEFNSKEIAQLMGVSIESVHTIRYRLRRKLGLDRSDNLSEFINDLV